MNVSPWKVNSLSWPFKVVHQNHSDLCVCMTQILNSGHLSWVIVLTLPSGIHQSAAVSLLGWWAHPEHSVSRGWFWIPLVSPHVLDWACELIPISWPLIASLYSKTTLRWFLKVIYSEVGSQNTLTPTGNSRLCTCNVPDLGWHNRGAFRVPVFGWFPATKNKYGIF